MLTTNQIVHLTLISIGNLLLVYLLGIVVDYYKKYRVKKNSQTLSELESKAIREDYLSRNALIEIINDETTDESIRQRAYTELSRRGYRYSEFINELKE